MMLNHLVLEQQTRLLRNVLKSEIYQPMSGKPSAIDMSGPINTRSNKICCAKDTTFITATSLNSDIK